MHNYFRIGGVAADLPYGWIEKCEDFCNYFTPVIDEYEKLITNNPIFRKRIEGLGTITRDEAINWGLSGPMLRGSGVNLICVKSITTNFTMNSIGMCSGTTAATV